MLRPMGLINGHYECRALDETLPVFTDLLAMEIVERKDGQAIVRHPNTDWPLVVHEGGRHAPDKPHNNYYGFRVVRLEEIEAAWMYIQEHRDAYGITRVTRPHAIHFATTSIYFHEPGGNDVEIEYYDLQAAAEGPSIAAPHWTAPLPVDRVPARGYIPQALTHGSSSATARRPAIGSIGTCSAYSSPGGPDLHLGRGACPSATTHPPGPRVKLSAVMLRVPIMPSPPQAPRAYHKQEPLGALTFGWAPGRRAWTAEQRIGIVDSRWSRIARGRGASSRRGKREDSMIDDLGGILVVDADGHVNEGDVDLAPRLPEAWRAIDFFGLTNLPAPNALKIARPSWARAERPTAAATP